MISLTLRAETTPWFRQRAHFGVLWYLSAADRRTRAVDNVGDWTVEVVEVVVECDPLKFNWLGSSRIKAWLFPKFIFYLVALFLNTCFPKFKLVLIHWDYIMLEVSTWIGFEKVKRVDLKILKTKFECASNPKEASSQCTL